MNLFSKRTLKKQKPLVLECDNFSPELKAQIIFILQDVFTLKVERTLLSYGQSANDDYWEHILHKIERKLCEEYGRFSLFGKPNIDFPYPHTYNRIFAYLDNFATTNEILDFIELLFNFKNFTETYTVEQDNKVYYSWAIDNLSLDQNIMKLNNRFKEHNIGYRFESNQIIKIDSEYSYSEITVPALHIISDLAYKNANDEFLEAHKHYKKGELEEALVDCRKAIESCLKIICQKRNWAFDKNKSTFKDLIDIVLKNGLIPIIHESGFGGLRAVLESGTILCNDKKAVHGKGTAKITIQDYEIEYVLNMTATTLLLLIKAEQNLK